MQEATSLCSENSASLSSVDSQISQLIHKELNRQQSQIELIASENFVSSAVLEAQGSILTNKYAEGYPGRRYYGGCVYVDQVEELAISRAKQLFGCEYANVQPHSGSQANQAVFLALMQPGDTFLAMDLAAGGHLTHGAAPNQSGKWFKPISYGVHPETHQIDYEQVEVLAHDYKPKVIIAGGSAYPRTIDFARFRQIADDVGAYLMVDQAHFAGLVAAGAFPSPLPYAHVVTTTTHKTLRGPRGGMILAGTDELAKKLNSAIFPGLQGGPLMHVIAAKAVAFKEALEPSFKAYGQQVIKNAQAMANTLKEQGIGVVTGGTDCHLVLLDLRGLHITGRVAEEILEETGLTCNKNAVPGDPLPPTQTSGVRVGSPAMTTRGFKEAEFITVGSLIAEVLNHYHQQGNLESSFASRIRQQVETLCKDFPLY